MTRERIAATGMGVISPIGDAPESFWESLVQKKCGAASTDRFAVSTFRSSVAALVNNFDPDKYIDVRAGRKMNRLSQMAVAASKVAFAEACPVPFGFAQDKLHGGAGGVRAEETGICFGTGFGCMETTESYLKKFYDNVTPFADPMDFPESVANAPAANAAIAIGCSKLNATVSHREGSAGIAAVQSALALLSGHARAVICGGAEEVTPYFYNVLDKTGALSVASAPAGPFDAARSGLIPGEGAGAVFFESTESAKERRAPAYGELAGFAMANDPSAPMSDWPDSSATYARTMAEALERAELRPRDVDAVVASANGTVKLDRREAEAIETVFGRNPVFVTSVKGHVGEFAGAGVFSILAALLMLRRQAVFPIARFTSPDSRHVLNFAAAFQSAPLRHVLVNFFSAGGSCASLVFKRAEA